MGIRNAKSESVEYFTVHRKARLTRLEPDSESREVEAPLLEQALGTDAENGPHDQPDYTTDKEESRTVEKSASTTAQHSSPGEETNEPASEPVKEKSTTKVQPIRRKPAKVAVQGEENGNCRVPMMLAYPTAGISPTFDQLADVQNEKVAFRLILGKALEAYATAVENGSFVDAPKTYAESTEIVSTSRMFSKAAYAKLAKTFNPTGLLSERAMGNMIGRRALAAFIASDKGMS